MPVRRGLHPLVFFVVLSTCSLLTLGRPIARAEQAASGTASSTAAVDFSRQI